jgi:FKBP-type peptidyl-prolyl cis-trans isomerase FkpA
MRAKATPIGPLTRGGSIRFWIGVLLLALLAGAAAWATTGRLHWESTASGLRYRVVERGEGRNAGPTDVVSVTYTGRLADGTVFDSNEGQPPAEMLVNQVVPGFGEALQMMNKGSTYEVRIPPELAYGERVPPGGQIPPNATLDFKITVVDTRPLSQEEMQQLQQMEMQQMMQMQQMQEQMRQQGGAPPPEGGRPEPEGGAAGRR